MFSEKELYILNWIQKVSEKNPKLNEFAICPYAAKSKFKIIECAAENIIPIDNYDVIIFIIESTLDIEIIQSWVNFYNSKYKDWKFFEDCASYDTYIQNVQTNNGKYNLILAQPKKKLQEFRKKLSKTNYYTLWSDDYLKEILEDDYEMIKYGIETP